MARYQNTLIINRTRTGKRFFSSAIPRDPKFSSLPRTYTASAGERWDQLAYKFYGSPIYWTTLANANGGADGSIFVEPGKVLRIPEI